MDKINCRVPFGTMNISRNTKAEIGNLLSSNGQVTNGQKVKEFEKQFAIKFGVAEAIAVSSGTDANTLALATMHDLGAERGDEVIIPALTFVATANAVVNAGFTPVFVDVDPYTLNIDYTQIQKIITERTRVIMPVHLMGKPAEMDNIMEIAKVNSINVIEDAAEAHGAMYRNQPVGTIAPIGCFSLYAAHIISSIEGGMVTTKSDYIAESIRSLRNHGLQLQGTDWTFKRIGFSSKMNEIEAIVGLGNLIEMEWIISQRRRNFFYLQKKLDKFKEYLYSIEEDIYEKLSPHAYPLIVRMDAPFTKEELVKHLTESGIDNRNLFYSIPTQTECYKYLGHKLGEFPNSEFLSRNGTHIGIHQDLNFEDLDYVAESIEEFICQKVSS